jgi:hypothetical protein
VAILTNNLMSGLLQSSLDSEKLSYLPKVTQLIYNSYLGSSDSQFTPSLPK